MEIVSLHWNFIVYCIALVKFWIMDHFEISCIEGENINGHVTRQLFSTHNFATQIINRFTIYTMLRTLVQCIRDSSGKLLTETFSGKLLEKLGFIEKTDSKYWKSGTSEYSHVKYKSIFK